MARVLNAGVWSAVVLLAGFASGVGGCVDSRARSGWPCDENRPCADGWECTAWNTCVRNGEPTGGGLGARDAIWSDISTDVADGMVCEPSCAAGCGATADVSATDVSATVADGCGGLCDCAIVVAERVAVPVGGDGFIEPAGLAVSPSGPLVADRVSGVVRRLTAGSWEDTGRRIPEEGTLVDLAWEPKEETLIALMREPDALVELGTDGSATVRVTLGGAASGLSMYNGSWWTTESDALVRRTPEGAVVDQLPETASTRECAWLAIRSGRGLRVCASNGMPGERQHRVAFVDVLGPDTAKVLSTWDFEVDATGIYGVAETQTGIWLLGRGYGDDADALVRVEWP